ncbi:4'-phosphopantetheinyl transferase [Paenibacillus sp. UNC496MF]|nr:4'-phosphopantetheinyl transferase [Paenibacillus sp. UNC496MF]
MLRIYAVNISEGLDKFKFDRLFNQLSSVKQTQIRRMLKYEDRVRSSVGEALVKHAIGKTTGMPHHEIRFVTNEYGKPQLADSNVVHFNIAHSGEWIVCATDLNPVGVDIEKIHSVDLQMARHFFSEAEFKQLTALPEAQHLTYFFDIWTLKESYIKADGRGLSLSLNSFSIIKKDVDIHLVAEEETRKFRFKQYDIDPAYKLSLCAVADEFPDQVIQIDVDMLDT